MYIYDILMSDNLRKSINSNLTYILDLIPELRNVAFLDYNTINDKKLSWDKIISAIEKTDRDFDVRISILLSNIDENLNNSTLSSYNILRRLGFDERMIDKICYLIQNKNMTITDKNINNNFYLSYSLFKMQSCILDYENSVEVKKYLESTKLLFDEYLLIHKVKDNSNKDNEYKIYKKTIINK